MVRIIIALLAAILLVLGIARLMEQKEAREREKRMMTEQMTQIVEGEKRLQLDWGVLEDEKKKTKKKYEEQEANIQVAQQELNAEKQNLKKQEENIKVAQKELNVEKQNLKKKEENIQVAEKKLNAEKQEFAKQQKERSENGRALEFTDEELDKMPHADPKQFLGLDSGVVRARFPGITFMPGYRLETFVMPDPHTCKERKLEDLTEYEAEERFYSIVSTKHIHCADRQRMGNTGDGGWDICASEPFKPKNDCLVYSFGISNDFSFDDAMAKHYNCSVISADPSMNKVDHWHSPKVRFLNAGLGEKDETQQNGWKMYTMGTLLVMGRHQNRTIDVLKVDIENAEWGSFKTMFKQGTLRQVKQLVFEFHTHFDKTLTYNGMAHTLLHLEQLGFRRFHWHVNPVGKRISPRTGKGRSCCLELFYVNLNFIPMKA